MSCKLILTSVPLAIMFVTVALAQNPNTVYDSEDTGLVVLPQGEMAAISPEASSTDQDFPSSFELISQPGISKELDLDEQQIFALRRIQEEASAQVKSSMLDLRSGKLSGADYTAQLIGRKALEGKSLTTLLLPHQLERLQQIAIQTQIRNAGTDNALSDETLSDLLNITEKQRAELKRKAVEVKRKLEEDIKRLKENAELELLSVLTKEQQSELRRLMGAKYERREEDFNDAIREHNMRNTKRDSR